MKAQSLRRLRKVLVICFLGTVLFGTISASATVSVSSLFGNNMVLQRDKPVPLWGTAAPNRNP
jgi:sialate O-acetylesterase